MSNAAQRHSAERIAAVQPAMHAWLAPKCCGAQGGAAGRTRGGWARCGAAARRRTAWRRPRCCCRIARPPTWTRWTSCWAGSASAAARAPWPARFARPQSGFRGMHCSLSHAQRCVVDERRMPAAQAWWAQAWWARCMCGAFPACTPMSCWAGLASAASVCTVTGAARACDFATGRADAKSIDVAHGCGLGPCCCPCALGACLENLAGGCDCN